MSPTEQATQQTARTSPATDALAASRWLRRTSTPLNTTDVFGPGSLLLAFALLSAMSWGVLATAPTVSTPEVEAMNQTSVSDPAGDLS